MDSFVTLGEGGATKRSNAARNQSMTNRSNGRGSQTFDLTAAMTDDRIKP